MLTGIDYTIVILYLLGILAMGIYFRKFVGSTKDYFLAGKSLPFWVIGMSIVVSDIGAHDFIGLSGQAYRFGISAANFDWIGSVPAMLLAAFVFIPYYWKSGMYTIPEYLGRRYNNTVRLIASLTWIVFFAFNLGIIFWASAVLFNTVMGWPIWVSIISIALITGIYTIAGGLTAVVMTDVVQMVIMFAGGAMLVIFGMNEVGGWDGLMSKIAAQGDRHDQYFDLILPTDTATPYPWTGILFGLTFVMSTAYWIGNQTIVQRCLAAKSEWHAKASMIWAAFLKMFIPVLVLFPGIIALALYPEIEDGDQALPVMIKSLLPPGVIGLMFAAFLAGMMSSIDSMLNSTVTLWTKDIYERYIKKGASDEHYLKAGRIATVVLVLFGVATSPISNQFPGIYVAFQTLLSFFQGPTFAILLLGMFWKGTTQWGGLSGLLGGMSVSAFLYTFQEAIFTISDPFLYVSWWSFVAGCIIAVIVSAFTQPHDAQRLSGLVFRLSDNQN